MENLDGLVSDRGGKLAAAREGGDAFHRVFSQGGSRTLEKTDAKLKVSSVRTRARAGSFPVHVTTSLANIRVGESWRTTKRVIRSRQNGGSLQSFVKHKVSNAEGKCERKGLSQFSRHQRNVTCVTIDGFHKQRRLAVSSSGREGGGDHFDTSETILVTVTLNIGSHFRPLLARHHACNYITRSRRRSLILGSSAAKSIRWPRKNSASPRARNLDPPASSRPCATSAEGVKGPGEDGAIIGGLVSGADGRQHVLLVVRTDRAPWVEPQREPRPIVRRDAREPRDFSKARPAQPFLGRAEHSVARATPSSQCVFTRG